MSRSVPLRAAAPVVIGVALAFGFAHLINGQSLAWLFTDELGRPFSEPLLRFWTWRLPLACGLGAIAIGLFVALRRAAGPRQLAAVTLTSAIAAAILTWNLYATSTQRSLREIAATWIIRPVDDPPSFVPFFSDHSDPAGMATNDPAVVARFAGCYDLGGYFRRGRGRIVGPPERVRLKAEAIESGSSVPAHPFLQLEPRAWMTEFWYLENGSAVLVWSAGLSGRSVMIRPDGGGGFIGVDGSGDDVTPVAWGHVKVRRVACDS